MHEKPQVILVVEDDEIVLNILAGTLQTAGWPVMSAQSGEEAIGIIDANESICMVLIDVGLPGMSGLDLAQWLRSKRKLPFVILTAHDEDEQVAAAVAHGALSYLVKPIDATKLLPIVRTALARHDDLQRLEQSVEHCERALKADRSVSVAVGILMQSKFVTEQDAFDMLRAAARSRRVKIFDVAKEIIKETPAQGR